MYGRSRSWLGAWPRRLELVPVLGDLAPDELVHVEVGTAWNLLPGVVRVVAVRVRPHEDHNVIVREDGPGRRWCPTTLTSTALAIADDPFARQSDVVRANLDAEINYSAGDGPAKPIPSKGGGKGKRLSRPNRPTSISEAASTERMPIAETGEFDAPIRPAI